MVGVVPVTMVEPLLQDNSRKQDPLPWTMRCTLMLGLAELHHNTGSTARDHLANERTYLAWLRTGLSMVSFGVGIAKFWRDAWGVAFSVFFVFTGIALLLYAALRYINNMEALHRDLFMVNTGGTLCLSFGTVVVAFLGATYVGNQVWKSVTEP